MPQIISITSEALQATIRRLLPSQQGFGEDLQASNVVTPIIDLTPSAEGSVLGTNLQTALAFGSNTAFDVVNTSTNLVATAGFYRVFGTATTFSSTTTRLGGAFRITDGTTTKIVWEFAQETNSVGTVTSYSYDFVVFLRSGDTLSAISNSADTNLVGSTRQIADVNGDLVNPSGFVSQ